MGSREMHGAGLRGRVWSSQPAKLTPVPTNEGLPFAMDQFTGSGHMGRGCGVVGSGSARLRATRTRGTQTSLERVGVTNPDRTRCRASGQGRPEQRRGRRALVRLAANRANPPDASGCGPAGTAGCCVPRAIRCRGSNTPQCRGATRPAAPGGCAAHRRVWRQAARSLCGSRN
jgi:hypothetical protein